MKTFFNPQEDVQHSTEDGVSHATRAVCFTAPSALLSSFPQGNVLTASTYLETPQQSQKSSKN